MVCCPVESMHARSAIARCPPVTMLAAVLLIAAASVATSVVAANGRVCVVDDLGRDVCLDGAARRIVALSPAATELLFAAGAGDRVRGAVDYSDYPEAARAIPRVGSHARLDMERLVAMQPDLIVAWHSGNPAEQVAPLIALGLTVFYTEPLQFEDIATSLERLGRLAGTETTADAVAAGYRAEIAALRARYANTAPVRVFYQIWDEPVMTVNDTHLIGQALQLCGGVNVFGELGRQVPRLDRESVLAAEPEAIVAGGMGEDDTDWLDDWARFKEMPAVQRGNLYFVPPSLIQRPTPRLADGTGVLCRKLERARAQR